MAELLEVLETEPLERSEWDLQRLLMWAENYKGSGFAFINELDPPEVSDVRIEVCRCMTVQRFKEGDIICKQGTKGDCMYVVMLGELDVVSFLSHFSHFSLIFFSLISLISLTFLAFLRNSWGVRTLQMKCIWCSRVRVAPSASWR